MQVWIWVQLIIHSLMDKQRSLIALSVICFDRCLVIIYDHRNLTSIKLSLLTTTPRTEAHILVPFMLVLGILLHYQIWPTSWWCYWLCFIVAGCSQRSYQEFGYCSCKIHADLRRHEFLLNMWLSLGGPHQGSVTIAWIQQAEVSQDWSFKGQRWLHRYISIIPF